jgi:ribonucleoside-diphosphate reductase alpha chain
MKWIWTNKNYIGGMSFLPESNAQYEQMPYVEISQDAYKRLIVKFPVIDWDMLTEFEQEDYTTVAQEVACTAGQCEIV